MYPRSEGDFAKRCPEEWNQKYAPNVAARMLERYGGKVAARKRAYRLLLNHYEGSWGLKFWEKVVELLS